MVKNREGVDLGDAGLEYSQFAKNEKKYLKKIEEDNYDNSNWCSWNDRKCNGMET